MQDLSRIPFEQVNFTIMRLLLELLPAISAIKFNSADQLESIPVSSL